jgi:hypothetical protein
MRSGRLSLLFHSLFHFALGSGGKPDLYDDIRQSYNVS